MTEGSETDGGNAIDNSQTTITLPISVGQLFGPFSNPLQWLTLRSSGSACDNSSVSALSHDLFSSVDIARDSRQQNMDVVYKIGQYYFEAIRNIDIITTNGETQSSSSSSPTEKQLPKLYAWFSDSIKANLPAASTSTLNGGTRFYCPLCNEVFLYPNPVVLHMLCTCPKRVRVDSIPTPNQYKSSGNDSSSTTSSSNRNSIKTETQQSMSTNTSTTNSVTKKRGFDIASLVNEDYCASSDNSSDKKRSKNGTDADVSSHYQNNSSAFQAPYISTTHNQNSGTISDLYSSMNSKSLVTSTSSAFKNVVQKQQQRYLADSAYDLSAFYQRMTASSMPPSMTAANNGSLYMPSLSISGSLSASLSSSLLPSQSKSLLPYLPPSLAALSYPSTTNFCAKCNASFRMTSDLVYHMRSHHKVVTPAGEQLKKKREEKLKCNICSETFRERHHLTRHMASHQ